MNSQIKSYADSIYEQLLMESVATLNADRTAYFSEVAARQTTYLPLGGPQIQAIIKFQVEHIERGVAARLDSYQKAFSEAGQIPTDQDLTDILNEFKAVHEGLVKQSSAVVTRFLTPGIPSVRVDPGPALAAGSAHGHDRVLRSWKVWRERARLNRASAADTEAPKPMPSHGGSEGKSSIETARTGWKQVGQMLWSWPVVGTLAVVPLGFAGNAVYAGDVLAAGLLCFFGIFLLAARVLLWDKTANLPYRATANIVVVVLAISTWLGALAWARQRSQAAEVRPLLTMRVSPSVLPLSVPPYSVTSVLQLHPFIGLTDKQDGLLKIANDAGKEGCWPSGNEMQSMGPNGHESVYRIAIGNHSPRTLASGKAAFGVKYNPGLKGGGCMPPSSTQFDQQDVVLIPPLEPGKSLELFAVNQSDRCAWLIPPDSVTVKMDGWAKEREVPLTFDKDPLYAAGAPVFSATAIEWEGVPAKPGGYGIVRTVAHACGGAFNASPGPGQPQPQRSKPEVKLMFKDSPLFTETRRVRITSEIDRFRRYLVRLGFDLPTEVPPIGVQTNKGLGPAYGWIYPGSVYDANIYIAADGVDDPEKIVESYAGYTFSLIFRRMEAPQEEILFRGESEMVIQKYYRFSFFDRFKTVSSEMEDAEKSLWNIRTKYGKEFADKTVFYAVQRWRPSPQGRPAPNFNAYFAQRILLGVDVRANDQNLTGAIQRLFEVNGVYPYPPQAATNKQ